MKATTITVFPEKYKYIYQIAVVFSGSLVVHKLSYINRI